MSITALNKATGEQVVNPQQLSATRCLYLLVMAQRTVAALHLSHTTRDPRPGQAALQSLVNYLADEQPRIQADIDALTRLLGVEIVVLDKVPSPERMDA